MKYIKNIVSLFSIYFFIACFSNCGNTKGNKLLSLDTTPPFNISQIYFQNWAAGIKEGGRGTNVYITLKSLDEGVKLEEIYFRNKTEALKKITGDSLSFIAFFRDDRSKQVIMDSNPIKESQNTPPAHFDLTDNEVVISYQLKGETKYFKISSVEERPMVAYPEVNLKGID